MSRQKSARGASSAAKAKAKPGKAAKVAKPRTAAVGGGRGVFVQAPRSDVYVSLLGISLAAMLLACLLMFLIWQKYEMNMKPTASLAHANGSMALA